MKYLVLKCEDLVEEVLLIAALDSRSGQPYGLPTSKASRSTPSEGVSATIPGLLSPMGLALSEPNRTKLKQYWRPITKSLVKKVGQELVSVLMDGVLHEHPV